MFGVRLDDLRFSYVRKYRPEQLTCTHCTVEYYVTYILQYFYYLFVEHPYMLYSLRLLLNASVSAITL